MCRYFADVLIAQCKCRVELEAQVGQYHKSNNELRNEVEHRRQLGYGLEDLIFKMREELSRLTQALASTQPLIEVCRAYIEQPGPCSQVQLWGELVAALAAIDQAQEVQGDALPEV